MEVTILDPKATIIDKEEIKRAVEFFNIIKDTVMYYGIEVCCINKTNYKKQMLNLDDNTILVVFNGEESASFDELYSIAVIRKTHVLPVAISKEYREPAKPIQKKQSFDVYEQLRKRDLPDEYIRIAADVFSRKIVSLCMPTILLDEFNLFLSHRRFDGEEITGRVCDELIRLAPQTTAFRDVINVKVGNDAQKDIDEALADCEVLVFFHTQQAATSDWILKELFYAIINNIPILWIRIGEADINCLKFKPSESPEFEYSEDDFRNQSKVTNIADQILKRSFELMMEKSNDVYDEVSNVSNMFGENLCEIDKTRLLYQLNYPRKGYRYPQRAIRQLIQFFGRKPKEDDIEELNRKVQEINSEKLDSAIILSNCVISRKDYENVLIDNYQNYKDIYDEYMNGKCEDQPYDIVISGAFPDGEEVYQQNLSYALICFAREILKRGYTLCFGAHPSFQELIFETAKAMTLNYREKVEMYISNSFASHNDIQLFCDRCKPIEIEKGDTIESSLTQLRETMIKRSQVKALICFGGKIKEEKKKEGVREEIEIAKAYGIPVFLIGSAGGCTSVIAQEYNKRNGWSEINSAGHVLNTMLMNSLDYKSSAIEIMEYLKNYTDRGNVNG